jgi:hypothetical protein
MKTKEEILDESSFESIEPGVQTEIFTKNECLNAMESYASQQTEKYNELIEVMEEIIQYYQGGKMFDGFDIAFHELSKLKMKIKQLKTELGL